MAIVEEVPEGVHETFDHNDAASRNDLRYILDMLSERLGLPNNLLPSFLDEEKPQRAVNEYRVGALSTLRTLASASAQSELAQLGEDDQLKCFAVISRLYGDDSWTSQEIKDMIDAISATVNCPPIATALLTHTLRPLFTSHPMLNPTTSRALSRPAGGPDALSDMHDSSSQLWKSGSAWGSHNILQWCCAYFDASGIEENIGLILPPTLTMMDDWEPPWRGRGAKVLSTWITKLPPETARRMGIYGLLVKSLIHTLSLHAVPPLPHVLPLTLNLIEQSAQGEKRADSLVDVMDKAVLSGWMYAPSGLKGREVLVQVASDLEKLCDYMGVGIMRWLKSIIPNLLQPLVYSPTAAVLPHFEANLHALLVVMQAAAPSGRTSRWRGQILNILCRLWVQLQEREKEGAVLKYGEAEARSETEMIRKRVVHLVRRIFKEMESQCPSIREVSGLSHLAFPGYGIGRGFVANGVVG